MEANENWEAGIAELEKVKAEHESKLCCWDALAHLASNLEGDFRAMRESTDFSAVMEELDRKELLMFPKASFITIGCWLEWGEFLTNALKTSSTVAHQMKSELAVIERDLANAVALREEGNRAARLRTRLLGKVRATALGLLPPYRRRGDERRRRADGAVPARPRDHDGIGVAQRLHALRL